MEPLFPFTEGKILTIYKEYQKKNTDLQLVDLHDNSMAQRHDTQHGIFHVTTNTKGRSPWCTAPGVPQLLIRNLLITKGLHETKIHAFCILPDHIHIILQTGPKGLSNFVKSFKENSSRDAGRLFRSGDAGVPAARGMMNQTPDFSRWQPGFHDELIRDQEQYRNAVIYVTHNAFKHGFVKDAIQWPWSSLHFEKLGNQSGEYAARTPMSGLPPR